MEQIVQRVGELNQQVAHRPDYHPAMRQLRRKAGYIRERLKPSLPAGG